MSATRASCFSLTIGPSCTSSRNGSPVRRRFAFSASVDVYASARLRWTRWRPAAKQTWPWNWNAEKAPAAAAASRSASSRTMNALFPPSSSETFLSMPPASWPTRRPTAVDPVNETTGMFGSVTRASPTSAPPTTTWSKPSGRPASANTAANIAPPTTGVWGSGLSTTALPRARAGATTRMPSTLGEFHGVIAPTTPTGTRRTIERRPLTAVGMSEPYACDGRVAALRISWYAKVDSWCILLWEAPVSRCVHSPNSSRWAS